MACPFSVEERNPRTGQLYIRPCGSCISCRIAHRTDWEYRIYHECDNEYNKGNYSTFATLTYADEFLSYTKDGHPTINELHIDKYLEKFKYQSKKLTGRTYKQFLVTEYGDRFGRPHAHSIIIGLDPSARKLVQYCWLRGSVMCLPVLQGGIRYVLKYMDKQIFGEEELKKAFGDCTPPFSRKSHGIGKDYIISHKDELLENNGYIYHGQKFPLSPYMISYLENYDPTLRDKKQYFDKKIKKLSTENNLSYLNEKMYLSTLREIENIKKSIQKSAVGDLNALNTLELQANSLHYKKGDTQKLYQLADLALGA